jgi:tetratricopeptide (TPR) repeat protein
LAEEWASSQIGHKSYWNVGTWQSVGGVFLASGRRKRAEEVFNELRAKATVSSNISIWLQSVAMDAFLEIMDGRFEDAMDLVGKCLARAEQDGVTGMAQIYVNHIIYRTRVYRGEDMEEIVRQHESGGIGGRGNLTAYAVLGWIQSYMGKKAEVSQILDKYVVNRPGFGTAEDESRDWVEGMFLESAVVASHRRAAEMMLNRLKDTGLYTTGNHFPTCITRHLGGAAALLGRYDEARKHYMEAIRVCTEMPFRPELALSRLQLAELLLEHYSAEKKEALEHLDFAIKEFREMKMQPSLERALRQKKILKA